MPIPPYAFQAFPRGSNTRFPLPGFYAGQLAISWPSAPERGQWHRHEFFEVFWIATDGGTHLNDFRSFPLVAGTLIFVSPGQLHTWQIAGELRGWVVCFQKDFLLSAFPGGEGWLYDLPFFFAHRSAAPPVMVVDDARQRAYFASLFGQLEDEYVHQHVNRVEAIRATLQMILVTARRACEAAHPELAIDAADNRAEALLTRQFFRELEVSFLTERRVEAYARRLGVTAKRLAAAVQSYTGSTPATLLRERVVLEAKRLLLHSGLNSAKIADQLGFTDRAHFARSFRRLSGCSPGEFRRENNPSSSTPPTVV